jgi:predicted lipid-binding transport protein (Tim44 family)
MRHLGTAGLVCSNCDPHLPAWQELLLGALALAIAAGLLYGVARLGIFSSRMRNMGLRVCFLGIQLAWGRPDAATRLRPYVTPELGERLRRQLAKTAARGETIHHERPRVERLTVVSGGGREDAECEARIRSSVRHWVTDKSGAVVGGKEERTYEEATWRFVRRGDDWIAAGIEFSKSGAASGVSR